MANKKMRKCKTCGEEIAKSAKICPKCGAKQKGSLGLIILLVIAALVVIGVLGSGGNSTSSSTSKGSGSGDSTGSAEEVPITYTEVGIGEMIEALENNAAAANDQYKGQFLAVTGQLSVIDAQGSYISISDPDAMFSFADCTCYIKNNQEIADKVKTLSKGDIITVKGEITDVGEVLGYSMTIHEIISQ